MNLDEIDNNWKKTPEDFRNDSLKFHSWFDPCDSIRGTISQGHIDFHTKILTDEVYKCLGDVKKKSCLEIGFGGGRLVNAASCVFSRVLGIDIHTCFDLTEDFLQKQGAINYTLLHYDEREKIENESIDFIFSFIVFQHFGRIQTFYDYLDLVDRVLTKDGCCNIYFGKNKWNNENFFIKDDVQEKTGYCTMFYKPEFVKDCLDNRGFQIISEGQRTKSPWVRDLSGQFYVTFKRK